MASLSTVPGEVSSIFKHKSCPEAGLLQDNSDSAQGQGHQVLTTKKLISEVASGRDSPESEGRPLPVVTSSRQGPTPAADREAPVHRPGPPQVSLVDPRGFGGETGDLESEMWRAATQHAATHQLPRPLGTLGESKVWSHPGKWKMHQGWGTFFRNWWHFGSCRSANSKRSAAEFSNG